MTLRVFVSGQRAFGAAAADLVIDAGHTLTGVASPAHGTGTVHGGQPVHDRLRAAARRHNTPWTESTRLSENDIPSDTDVILAAHSHAFLGARTRARAHLAAIGYHPSLLPLHRGRDAIRWTIRDRDKVTGGSIYHLTGRVDGGPLAAQDYLLVPPGATARSLWRDHLAPLGLRLIRKTLDDLDRGIVVCVPQDESLATWEPSWERPRLHRPELLELPGPNSTLTYRADATALRTA
jgi:methionyl-tRNA formyltransferase